MEDLKEKIKKQIELLEKMINENERKEEIVKNKKKLDELLNKYVNRY